MPNIHFVSSDSYTVTFIIDGKRWHYALATPQMVDDCVYLARRVSAGKALAYAKKRATAEAAA